MLILIYITDASTASSPKTKWTFLFGSIPSNSAGRPIPKRAPPPPPPARSGKSVRGRMPRYAQNKEYSFSGGVLLTGPTALWCVFDDFLQNGLHSSVQEEGGQREFKSTGCCSSVQLVGCLEGL